MAIINGSGQIVNYALSIMGWFSIIFPAKIGHVINHHFSHVGRTNVIMEGGGGVHGKFLHILVQEFVS